MTYRNYIIFLLIVLTLTGCKAKRRVVDFTTPVAEKSDDALFRDILAESFPYETLSARLDLKLTNGTRSRSSKRNRIVKDNAMQSPCSRSSVWNCSPVRRSSTIALLRMEKRVKKRSPLKGTTR